MNWLLIVVESVRYDLFMETPTPNIDKIGKAERAYSAADWTLPSVMSMMTGMLPHNKNDDQIIRKEMIERGLLAEGMWLPSIFQKLGHNTMAYVGIPWLQLIDRDWTKFVMMDVLYRNAKKIADEIRLEEPFFCYLHIGDTHCPYGGEPIPKNIIDMYNGGDDVISKEDMEELKKRQKEMLAFVDSQIGRILSKTPKGTKVIVTADHGELFGENHKFGHGCGFHKKVFEVPLIIGEI